MGTGCTHPAKIWDQPTGRGYCHAGWNLPCHAHGAGNVGHYARCNTILPQCPVFQLFQPNGYHLSCNTQGTKLPHHWASFFTMVLFRLPVTGISLNFSQNISLEEPTTGKNWDSMSIHLKTPSCGVIKYMMIL